MSMKPERPSDVVHNIFRTISNVTVEFSNISYVKKQYYRSLHVHLFQPRERIENGPSVLDA
jgi:hypothetical protein